jgi:hypothetical protein
MDVRCLSGIGIYADMYLRPHDRYLVGRDVYVGITLFAEMCEASRWPKWMHDVFWDVT